MAKIYQKNIEGLKYLNNNLSIADFKYVKAGNKYLHKFLLGVLGIAASFLSSVLLVLSGTSLGSIVFFASQRPSLFSFQIVSLTIYTTAIILIVLRSFEVSSMLFIILGTLISISPTIILQTNITTGISLALFLTLSIALAWIGQILISFFILFTYINNKFLGGLIAFIGANLITIHLTTKMTSEDLNNGEFAASVIAAVSNIIMSLIIARKALRAAPNFIWIKKQAVFWAAIGGTSFYGADLTDACFDRADLPHTDFRKAILTRTSFEGATRLDLSRLQGTILEQPKVRKLLVTKIGKDEDYTGANFVGANLRGANLTGAILKEVKALDADFSGATLTGACIENWSINSETRFTGVQCDYIFRELDENGKGTAQYPVDRNFEPGEFESLFQQVGNVVELIFKEGLDWRALSFSFRKLQLDDEGLGLELKGVEKRGDLWVVKVAYKEGLARPMVEERVSTIYDDIKNILAVKEQQINKLLGIASDQAEALKNQSRQPFGNNFVIFGSTITNLAGSGQIDYDEAASKIRSIVANSSDIGQVTPIAQNFLQQLQTQSVATSSDKQVELIQQVILTEAKKDPFFKQFLVQQSQQIMEAMPENAITLAIRNAIAQLN